MGWMGWLTEHTVRSVSSFSHMVLHWVLQAGMWEVTWEYSFRHRVLQTAAAYAAVWHVAWEFFLQQYSSLADRR